MKHVIRAVVLALALAPAANAKLSFPHDSRYSHHSSLAIGGHSSGGSRSASARHHVGGISFHVSLPHIGHIKY